MKKLFVIAVAALVLAACATVGQPVQLTSKTPAQIAADVCPSVQAVIGVLSVPGAVDPAVEADLAVAGPIVNTVCNGGALVTLPDLKSLSSVVPVLVKVVQLSPLPDDDKRAATLGIALIQAALAPLVQ